MPSERTNKTRSAPPTDNFAHRDVARLLYATPADGKSIIYQNPFQGESEHGRLRTGLTFCRRVRVNERHDRPMRSLKPRKVPVLSNQSIDF
jgi:hypothetical protein